MSQPIRLSGVDSEPPRVVPYPWGLLSVAEFTDGGDTRWEIAGSHYQQDACGPGGGIWLDPCYVQPLPDPTTEQAFSVALNKAADGDVLVATLTARLAGYGTTPVRVTVDGLTQSIAAVNGTATWPVDPVTTVAVSASIGATGKYPPGSVSAQFDVPDTDTGGTATLAANVAVPPDYPTKTIAAGTQDVTGTPFMIYDTASCGVGLSDADAQASARNRLAAREQYWAESRFDATELTNDNPTGITITELGGGTAMPLVAALGLLEREIAHQYGGIGVVHASREVAAAAQSQRLILRPDDAAAPGTGGPRLRTALDNLWSFGAGYNGASPDDVAAPAGQTWLYATGPVLIHRSEVQVRSDFDVRRNLRLALAERAYLITADCLRLAVLAELPGAS